MIDKTITTTFVANLADKLATSIMMESELDKDCAEAIHHVLLDYRQRLGQVCGTCGLGGQTGMANIYCRHYHEMLEPDAFCWRWEAQ